jgi:hypothetical protein
MNGTSIIAWRKYESAVERLKRVYEQLETDKGRDEVLSKVSIALPRDLESTLPGIRAVVAALGEAIKADVPKYLAGVIHKAQDDVKAAADDVRRAIDADLKCKFMRD